MKPVTAIRFIAVVAAGACAASAETNATERSFGTPEMTLVKETGMKGRKVLRYEYARNCERNLHDITDDIPRAYRWSWHSNQPPCDL